MDRRITTALFFIVASFGLLGYALWRTNILQDVVALQEKTTQSGPTVRLAAFGDNHTDNEIFHTILRDISTQPYDALLHLGDSTDYGTTEEFSIVRRQFSQLPFPTIHTVGNHDIKPDLTRTRFTAAYQQAPCSSRNVGHVHTISLDNADRKVGFSDDCLEFLQRDLAAHQTEPIIITYHRPFNLPLNALTGDDETPTSRASNIRFIEYIQSAPNIVLLLSGHVHTYINYSLAGIRAVVSGGGGDAAQRALGGQQNNYFHYLDIVVHGSEVTVTPNEVQLSDS
jgi:3',5'-cyclic AMP phosphodiesterase CpdA